MKVVILCGGMGTRIREHYELLPKPMIPIGSRPIVWHIMKYYAHFGFTEFVLCLGYKREVFIDYFLNYRYHQSDLTVELGPEGTVEFHGEAGRKEDWRVTLADTGLRTCTGSRLRRAARYLDDGSFMLTYGDGLATVDLLELLSCHRSYGKLATVSAVHPASRFGEIEVQDRYVTSFAEKPQTSAGFINGGFMVLEKEFIERYIAEDNGCVLESDALPVCARDGQLIAHAHEGFWQCMDTQREHQLLEELWNGGNAPWHIWDQAAPVPKRRKERNQSCGTSLKTAAS